MANTTPTSRTHAPTCRRRPRSSVTWQYLGVVSLDAEVLPRHGRPRSSSTRWRVGPRRRRRVSQRQVPNLGAVGLRAELLAPSGARPRRPNKARWPSSSALCHLTPSLQTSPRPDSTPRSGPLRPRRGPLLLPPSILKTAGLLSFSSPPRRHQTLASKIDPRCHDLGSRSFLEVMVPPLLQSIRVDVLTLSLIMWNHGVWCFGIFVFAFAKCMA